MSSTALLLIISLFTTSVSGLILQTPSRLVNERLLAAERELITVTSLLFRHDDWMKYDTEAGEIRPNSSEIRSFLQNIESSTKSNSNDDTECYYTTNPIGIFTLHKRLVLEWPEILKTVQLHKHYIRDIAEKYRNLQLIFPTEDELLSATSSIFKIQMVRGLKAQDIVRGQAFGAKLTAGECFELGNVAQELQQFYYAIEWYEEARRLSQKEGDETLMLRAVGRLAAVYYKLRHLEKAISLIEEVIEAEPNNGMAANNLHFYQRLQRDDSLSAPEVIKPALAKTRFLKRLDDACGNVLKTNGKLECFYHRLDPGNPFSCLPSELLRRRPRIVMYHDLINNKILHRLMNGVLMKITETMYSDIKHKDHNWALLTNSHTDVQKINRMFTELTGIDSELALSGFITILHGAGVAFDDTVDMGVLQHHGNKTSTLMVFLNDVTEGGELAFPYLNLTVTPKKGSAVFWQNTKPNGKVDRRLRWAGCPIIRGSKLVMHKVYRDLADDPHEDDDKINEKN